MRASSSRTGPCLALALLVLAGCAEPAPMQVEAGRHPAVTGEAAQAQDVPPGARPVPGANGQWVAGGEPGDPVAAWGAPASEAVLRFYCDRAAGRIVLEREASALPAHVRVVTLEADGIDMDYPAERVSTHAGARLVTRIALDAPVLDRLLATPQLTVRTGDEALRTSAPGGMLGPVLDACRARY